MNVQKDMNILRKCYLIKNALMIAKKSVRFTYTTMYRN